MVTRFIARDDKNISDLVKCYVLPGLKLLRECKSEFDAVEKIIEDIRENWCSFLSESTGEYIDINFHYFEMMIILLES